jgi:hypothetical protein
MEEHQIYKIPPLQIFSQRDGCEIVEKLSDIIAMADIATIGEFREVCRVSWTHSKSTNIVNVEIVQLNTRVDFANLQKTKPVLYIRECVPI